MTKVQLNIGTTHRPLLSDATITDGVLRWDSNGAVPFDDMLQQAVEAGHPVDAAASAAARLRETRAFLTEYRKLNQGPPSGEQLAEMRAEFGTGTTVLNVVTGRVTKL